MGQEGSSLPLQGSVYEYPGPIRLCILCITYKNVHLLN